MLTPIIDKESVLKFASWQQQYERFLIIGHVNPDGDAVGSCLALGHYLRSMGKKATVAMPNVFPDYFKWMPGADRVMFYSRCPQQIDKLIEEAEVICCLDFNQLGRIEQMADPVRQSKAKKLLLDHHLGPEDFADITISHPHQSSTCELLYRFLCDLGHFRRMNVIQATCIYTGMMTDTGSFSYNSNDPEIYYIISNLLRKGVDKDLVYRRVNYNYSANRLLLQGQVLSNMEVVPALHTAFLKLTHDQQQQYTYLKGESEGFVNLPLQIKEVICTVFVRDDTERQNKVRISLRSIGDFPVNEVAARFGGGGHMNAAGCEMSDVDTHQATEKIKEVLQEYQPLLQACFDKHPK